MRPRDSGRLLLTLSKSQYGAGDDSGIYHGINLVQDAVQSVSGIKGGVGILDNDYEIALMNDKLIMLWIFKVC